jgi:c-di-GMP-binding flagellar brake protein YcgR
VPDRRAKTRFEIVGRLPGTLAAERPVRLLDVSLTGALIETDAPLQPETTFNVTLETDQQVATIRARVCHVRRTHLDDGYLVGLEFLGAEPNEMERLLHPGQSGLRHVSGS